MHGVEAVLVYTAMKLHLSKHLVREGVAHHETGMSCCTAEIQEPAFSEDDDAVAISELPFCNLGLDVDLRDVVAILESGHFDLVVKVPDIANDGVVLHAFHVGCGDDIEVAGCGDEDVALSDGLVKSYDFIAFHSGLQGADRIDFGNEHAASLASKRLGTAFAYVSIAADDGGLACEHDICRSHDAVNARMAAAVEVVELALGDRVVDVDGGKEQFEPASAIW